MRKVLLEQANSLVARAAVLQQSAAKKRATAEERSRKAAEVRMAVGRHMDRIIACTGKSTDYQLPALWIWGGSELVVVPLMMLHAILTSECPQQCQQFHAHAGVAVPRTGPAQGSCRGEGRLCCECQPSCPHRGRRAAYSVREVRCHCLLCLKWQCDSMCDKLDSARCMSPDSRFLHSNC